MEIHSYSKILLDVDQIPFWYEQEHVNNHVVNCYLQLSNWLDEDLFECESLPNVKVRNRVKPFQITFLFNVLKMNVNKKNLPKKMLL